MDEREPPIPIVLLLAGVAGFVDAAAYLLLGHLFVAHVTGNANRVGQRLARGDFHAVLPPVVMLAIFVASIALATALIDRARNGRAIAHGVELVLLAVLAGAPGGFWMRVALAVAAMGVQTAAVTKHGGRTVRTTYLSGMSTRLGQSLVRGEPSAALLYGALIVAFGAGAAGGAAAFIHLGVPAFALAAGAVTVVLVADVSSCRPRKRLHRTPIKRRVTMFRPQARIMLQPIAAPSVLGNFALGSALIIYGSWFAAGWGTEKDVSAFFPFVLFFGGFGQLAAALWAYRARGAATAALHGSWAAFWLGIALMYLLVTTHSITTPVRGAEWQSLGQWMIYMAVVSWTTAFAALARSAPSFLAQATLGTGAALAAAGLLVPSAGLQHVAGWFFVAAGTLAFYAGATLMIGAVFGTRGEPVQYALGDPGVKVGQ